jgi:hypothetical protein
VARIIRNRRVNYANAFNSATLLAYQLSEGSAIANQFPGIAPNNILETSAVYGSVLGLVNSGNAAYNFDIQGNLLPSGQAVDRTFGAEEYELYAQDTWQISRGFTVTAGLRWSLMPPVREVNGEQASVIPTYSEFVARRVGLADAGLPSRDAGRLGFVALDSPGGQPLYAFHTRNFGPRVSLAYSPQATDGFLAADLRRTRPHRYPRGRRNVLRRFRHGFDAPTRSGYLRPHDSIAHTGGSVQHNIESPVYLAHAHPRCAAASRTSRWTGYAARLFWSGQLRRPGSASAVQHALELLDRA